jgi:hypothetical protein
MAGGTQEERFEARSLCQFPAVIASQAKQSPSGFGLPVQDCFVAFLLVMKESESHLFATLALQ